MKNIVLYPYERSTMMEKIKIELVSITDYALSKRKARNTKLDDINNIVDWAPFERLLKKHIKRKVNAVGNPAYPALIMFKCLILQRLYDLSDKEMEESLADRLSFLRFVGIGLEDAVPDASTICRFRNALARKGLGQKLLDLFTLQLRRQGLDLKKGIAVDASIIQSARHPHTVLEPMPEDRAEEEVPTMGISHSDDAEAAWVKKGNRSYYGYKVHAAGTAEKDIILGGHITPANHSDMKELPRVLQEVPAEPGMRVYADKGYASAENRQEVQRHGFRDGIMRKAMRSKGLSHWEQLRNKSISKVRGCIERVFGNLKRNRGFARSRYIGIVKVTQEFFLAALAANMVRSLSLLSRE